MWNKPRGQYFSTEVYSKNHRKPANILCGQNSATFHDIVTTFILFLATMLFLSSGTGSWYPVPAVRNQASAVSVPLTGALHTDLFYRVAAIMLESLTRNLFDIFLCIVFYVIFT